MKKLFHKKFGQASIIWRVFLFVLLMMVCPSSALRVDKTKTPDYFEYNVRSQFKDGEWNEGKRLLDEGIKLYPDVTGLNELMGMYYYDHKQYDKARFFLIKSVRADDGNVRSKQLLVKVEEDTKNYSSAICYVNELLEVNPYWKGLWLKKVSLYRDQGNYVESDRLLKRLYQIYPNDESLRLRYLGRMEENYVSSKKNKDLPQAIANMRAMLDADPQNGEYYNELCNLLIQQGSKEEALGLAERGLVELQGNTQLARKKVGILSEQHRYSEAISFLKEYTKKHASTELVGMIDDLEQESAYDALRNDPYVQFGRLYEKKHSSEALTFLLNTAVARGYNDDALYYIGQAKKTRRNDPNLLYKEYLVYKRMGNMKKAFPLIIKVYNLQPKNKDIVSEICEYHLNQAIDLMSNKLYSEALPHLDFVIKNDTTTEILRSAWNKKYVCFVEDKKYIKAMDMLDSINPKKLGQDQWSSRKVFLLGKTGHVEQALTLLKSLALQEKDNIVTGTTYNHFAEDYEEMAVPYIKSLISKGATLKAAEETKILLEIYPNSQSGLMFAITTSSLLGKNQEFESYVDKARQFYPNDVSFIIKQASIYNNHKDFQHSMSLLRPNLDSLMGDTMLVKAYSQSCDLQAMQLLKKHQNKEALNIIDSALIFDGANRMLLYDKGMVFEALGQYDSAYYYQKFYQPSMMEVTEQKQHLNELQYRGHNNEISLDYLQSRFGEEDVVKGLASVSYTHRKVNNTYIGTLNYSGRDGYVNTTTDESYIYGGTGIQLIGEWQHKFSSLWGGAASVGWSNRYFPTLQLSLKVERYLKNDLMVDVHAGFRRVETNERTYKLDSISIDEYSWVFDKWKTGHSSLFVLGVGFEKEMWPFMFTGKFDGMSFPGKFYFNASTQAKYFPLNDRVTSIVAQVGAGTAPESTILDYGLPGSFSHLNTMVGLGGTYMITSNLSAMLMGTWHTFYNQTNMRIGNAKEYQDDTSMRYKNLFNIYVQLNLSF